MARYRIYPTATQETVLLEHCAHARYVWNLAWNLHQFGQLETYGKASRRVDRDGREYIYLKRRPVSPLPGYVEQARMLTDARAEYAWLAAGSVVIQQQALRDFDQAMRNFYAGTHGRPRRRKRYEDEGFRIVSVASQDVRHLNRRWGQVRVPKVGWVRFRWSRTAPGSKSYRVTLDRSGRWHVAFAARPDPVPAPGTGEAVGVDRGVVITAALSTGEKLHCPGLTGRERARLRKAERRKARAPKGSLEQQAERARIARLRAREADRRKDWCEKTSTGLARRFDLIRFEDLRGQDHDPLRARHSGESGPERPAEGGPEPGDPGPGLGPARPPHPGQGARPGGEGQSRVHQPALQRLRVARQELARQPSRVLLCPLRLDLQRGSQRGNQHRGGATPEGHR
jgi:putative transposase